MRVGQVVAVLFCLAAGLLGADWEAMVPRGDGVMEAHAAGNAMGHAIGWTSGPFLLSALFLVWFRSMRRYIPFLAAGFVVMSAAGRAGTRSAEVDRELSRTRGIMNALVDSGGPGMEGSSTPPESQDGKLVWAMNRALAELPAYKEEVAARHGVDPDNLPAGWGTSRYMASASSHPEVERYWRAYRSYLADFREGYPGWLRSRVTTHGREAGVRSAVLRSYVAGMQEGGAGFAESEQLAWADSTATAALAYHRYLVSVDAGVSYDAAQDMAIFDSEADLARANALQERVVNASATLARAQEASRQRTMHGLDSLAVKLR